ncbi:hypothetical protein AURDEDRAFT_163869 [Auricularia subglabra TFB-10046 SS5]|nr:hypothetical protein AURDEDRAFT_163869 [Auricularia subglabra TFB-10046 SS5]
MPLPFSEVYHAMYCQLHGLGPFTFQVDNDLRSSLCPTHIQLVSNSTKRVRGVEVNMHEHWWRGWSEACFLKELAACSLTSDIVLVHIAHRPKGVGYSSLKLISEMHGEWPAVRTVRIDVFGGNRLKERLRSQFPALVQVVLFHPALPRNTAESEVLDFCSNVLELFAHSATDTLAVVLTRDDKTADLVTADPGAAVNNPHCVVYRQATSV